MPSSRRRSRRYSAASRGSSGMRVASHHFGAEFRRRTAAASRRPCSHFFGLRPSGLSDDSLHQKDTYSCCPGTPRGGAAAQGPPPTSSACLARVQTFCQSRRAHGSHENPGVELGLLIPGLDAGVVTPDVRSACINDGANSEWWIVHIRYSMYNVASRGVGRHRRSTRSSKTLTGQRG